MRMSRSKLQAGSAQAKAAERLLLSVLLAMSGCYALVSYLRNPGCGGGGGNSSLLRASPLLSSTIGDVAATAQKDFRPPTSRLLASVPTRQMEEKEEKEKQQHDDDAVAAEKETTTESASAMAEEKDEVKRKLTDDTTEAQQHDDAVAAKMETTTESASAKAEEKDEVKRKLTDDTTVAQQHDDAVAAEKETTTESASAKAEEKDEVKPKLTDDATEVQTHRVDEQKPSFLDDPNAAFGGCLMIMDDNHFLAEWLAYHYYMMPLRHLVVYIDQKSRTSPLPILERFKDMITFEIVDWTYPDAYSEPPEAAKGSIHADPTNRKLVGEQLKFYEDCMRWYKRNNWNSWISVHNTDEFISVNPQVRNEEAKIHLPGVPDNTEPGSIMKWLQMVMGHRLEKTGYHTSCLGVPRMQMCTEEPKPTSTFSESIGMEDENFVSLRWSTFPKGKAGTRAPKDLVYIGGIDKEYFEEMDMLKNGARPHEVIPEKCVWHQRREGSPFQIYHYSGTPEQRQFRVDPRGKFGSRPGSPPADECGEMNERIEANDIKPWLGEFVKEVGDEKAKQLLQNVGEVRGWPDYTGPIPQTLGVALPQ